VARTAYSCAANVAMKMSNARQVLATFAVLVALPCAVLLGLWLASRWPVPECHLCGETVGEDSTWLNDGREPTTVNDHFLDHVKGERHAWR
jgi:hypothetical protein